MSETEQPTPTRVTDKRGKKAKPAVAVGVDPLPSDLPTAQELLDQGDPVLSVFDQQSQEEAERQAAFDAMTDEEKQAYLLQQAAENEGTPYAGGGMQNEAGEQKKTIMSAFVVVIDLDGTAYATNILDTSMFEMEREVTPMMMYRSCAEIMSDINCERSAAATLHGMAMQASAMQSQMRAQQAAATLAQGLQTRGMGRRG